MKFTLSLSVNYVRKWTELEAIRELLQNAFDRETESGEVRRIIDHNAERKSLVIGNRNSHLSRSTLLLGCGSKMDNADARGEWGEGYKLAMLVLARSVYGFRIRTGGEIWEAKIEHSDDFGDKVLNVYVYASESYTPDLTFEIDGITAERWQEIHRKVVTYEAPGILKGEPGRVYVGGLFVCHDPQLRASYNFRPGEIPLNRDRDMTSSFDLHWATSSLWAKETEYVNKLYDLLEAKAPDVQYIDHVTAQAEEFILRRYQSEWGKAVPVSTDDERNYATARGETTRTLPAGLVKILRRAGRSAFKVFTSRPTPNAMLQEWYDKHHSDLADVALDELRIILTESQSWKRG